MFFQSWSEFFNMGGYGFYVWLSYGISFAAILLLGLDNIRAKNNVLREVKREQQRIERQQSTKQGETL